MRAALVAIAVLSFAGCTRGLDSFEPFACANDGTCPARYGCTAELRCVSLNSGPVIPCTTNVTCPLKMACDPVSKSCLDDCSGGCPAPTTCSVAGVCRVGKPEGTVCLANSDCVDGTCGQFLTSSVCVTPCTTGQDCETGARACVASCTNEGCTAAINLCRIPCTSCPGGWSCAGDKGCQPGRAVGFSCDTTSQCASRRCEGPAGAAICVDSCSAANPACSTSDAMCLTAAGYCVLSCSAGQACPLGGSCAKGVCVPGKPIGAGCTLGTQCASGSCRTTGYPGGVCVVEDCSTANLCPAGSNCAPVCSTPDCLQVKSICLATCTLGAAECRTGYGCLPTFGVNVCRPMGAGTEGQSCTTAANCLSGFCLSSPAGTLCRTLCGSDSSCAGGICSATTSYSNFQVCGSACAAGTCNASSDTCACFASNTSTTGGAGKRGCQPKCTQDSNCFDGSVCDLVTGLCGPRPCSNAAGCPADSFCTWNQAFDNNCSTLDSGYAATCKPRLMGATTVGTRCTGPYCADSICAGATAYTKLGFCSVACPDGMGCPGGTTCSSVDRPSNPSDGTGKLQSIKLCVLPPSSNINGPCSAGGGQCPLQQLCTQGFCDGKGQLGSPCPGHDSRLECSLPGTDYCTWRIEVDGGSTLSTCTKSCTTTADCVTAGFVKGCCRLLNSGDKGCWTQAMCGDAGS